MVVVQFTLNTFFWNFFSAFGTNFSKNENMKIYVTHLSRVLWAKEYGV